MPSNSNYIWIPEYKRILNLLKNEEKHKLPKVSNGSYAIRIPDELKQAIYPISGAKSVQDCWVFICLKHEGFGKEMVTDYFIISEEKFKNYWLCPTLGAYATLNKLHNLQ